MLAVSEMESFDQDEGVRAELSDVLYLCHRASPGVSSDTAVASLSASEGPGILGTDLREALQCIGWHGKINWNTLGNPDTDFGACSMRETAADETSKEVVNAER